MLQLKSLVSNGRWVLCLDRVRVIVGWIGSIRCRSSSCVGMYKWIIEIKVRILFANVIICRSW